MDSLIFALLIAVAAWIMFQRAKKTRAQRAQAARSAAQPAAGGPRTMPRIGTPGTVTREQLQSLKENDFEPSREWSREEAQLILDAVAYLRAAIALTTGDRDAPIEVQNKVLALMLGEAELRDHMLDWSRNLTADERASVEAAIPRDAHFARVQAFVRELWDEGGADK
jgi:hypothetical protein